MELHSRPPVVLLLLVVLFVSWLTARWYDVKIGVRMGGTNNMLRLESG